MENPTGVESLFFELASESRLSILRELSEKSWKMKDIARKLDLTTTETFRQMQRLNEASLIQKQPYNAYSITLYGTLILQLSPSFEFLSKHKEYFLKHDVRRLPYQFLNRIGELSEADLRTDIMENINTSERITREAEHYMWGGGVEQPLNIGPIIEENIPKGVRYRFLFPKRFLPHQAPTPETVRNIEWRSIDDMQANIVLTEKEVGISFNLVGGKADYVGFVGKDPMFHNWVKDLFLYYWDKGKRA